MTCRPCSKQEVASRTPQIIQVVEANKEVVLMQSVAGKHMGRAFHYDKVCRLFPLFMLLVSFQRLVNILLQESCRLLPYLLLICSAGVWT